jgi:hypothetical protein
LHQGFATAWWLLGKLFTTKRRDELVKRRTITLRARSKQQQDVVIPPKLSKKRGEQQIPTIVAHTITLVEYQMLGLVQENKVHTILSEFPT